MFILICLLFSQTVQWTQSSTTGWVQGRRNHFRCLNVFIRNNGIFVLLSFLKLLSKILACERLLLIYLVDLFLKHLTTNTPIPSFMTLVSRHCSSFNRILYFRHLFLDCDWLNFHMNEIIIVLSIEEPGRNYSRSDLLPLIEWTSFFYG